MASQKGLGKGLGALLGDFAEEPQEKSAYQSLPIYKVNPTPTSPGRTLTLRSWRTWRNPSGSTV